MALTDETKDIIDLNIDGVKKQRFRINGDPNSIIELDLSDLRIIDRLEDGLQKLETEMRKIAEVKPEDDNFSEVLNEADARMREYIDYIFDYPVSAVCARYGTMYDPKDGMFRYEHIIDALTKLYQNNINDEYKKFQARIKKHTDKYTNSPASLSLKKKGK